ncbi:MAG: DUF3786 domain-containing protein [Nitrospiraceae bacterium]|nr:DUF3786 domain-containing protein [Nitrospiraceae bacterium]
MAWGKIRELGPEKISASSGISFINGLFMVRSLGMDFELDPASETIRALSPQGGAILKKFSYFFNYMVLWWLVYAKGTPPSGRLVRPADLKGGDMFFRGTHTLPLDRLAQVYARDAGKFLERAGELGGSKREMGDAAAELMPVQGFSPVDLILWLEDEEFPARADLLLDASIEHILPLDIIWCATMLTTLAML